MKALNLYAGLGGNRQLWQGVDVTAIEYTDNIANIYCSQFPDDAVIITDAHKYLLEHFDEYDFIWSSPPCQSHSRFIRGGKNRKPRYADLKLYEEILLLQNDFNGLWVVENVVPYYMPLIVPSARIGRHLFWSNFEINENVDVPEIKGFITKCNTAGANELKKWLGISYKGNIYYEGNHDPSQVLRNAVHPILGNHVFCEANKASPTK
jgi:DNA (cytosine-5)-methyltransferase 1